MSAKRRKISCEDAVADILRFVDDEDEDFDEARDSDDDEDGADDLSELNGNDGTFIFIWKMIGNIESIWINCNKFFFFNLDGDDTDDDDDDNEEGNEDVDEADEEQEAVRARQNRLKRRQLT